MKKILLLTLCVLFLPRLGWAWSLDKQDIDWAPQGDIYFRVYQDAVDNHPYEDQFVTDAWFELKNKIEFKDYNLTLQMDFGGRSETFVNGDTNSQADLYMKEAYLSYQRDNQRLRVGRQIVTWGKLDDVAVLDRVNPQDYKRFILDDKQERKLPAWMVQYSVMQEDWQVEALYLPVFRSSDLHYFGNDWAVFDHLKEGIDRGDYSAAVKNTVKNIAIQEKDSVTDNSLANGQGAIRFRSRIGDIDYGLYYMNVLASIPTLKEMTAVGNLVKQFLYTPTMENLAALVASGPGTQDLVLEREHPRTNVFGADWETVLGSVGLRGEAALITDQPFLKRDYSYTEKDMVSLGVGADYTFENNLYVDVQIIEDVILDYEDLYPQEQSSHQLTGSLTKDFWRGMLHFNFDWSCRPSYGDWMINPEIRYKVTDDLKVSLGTFIFSGDISTLFGAYDTNDVIYSKMQYSF